VTPGQKANGLRVALGGKWEWEGGCQTAAETRLYASQADPSTRHRCEWVTVATASSGDQMLDDQLQASAACRRWQRIRRDGYVRVSAVG
jgi:hypothetical protein